MYHKMITNKPTYFIDTGTIVNAGKNNKIYTAYLYSVYINTAYIISVYIIYISVYYTGARTPLPHIPFLDELASLRAMIEIDSLIHVFDIASIELSLVPDCFNNQQSTM